MHPHHAKSLTENIVRFTMIAILKRVVCMENVDQSTTKLKNEISALRRRIAELEAHESDLRRNELIYHRVMQEANDGIMIVDETRKIVVFNAAQEKITRRSAAEVIGMDAVDLQFSGLPPERQTPETYRRFREAMDQILSTGYHPLLSGIHEYSYLDEAGQSHTVQKSAFTIKTDKGHMLVSFDRDITERKRMEARLRQSEQRYELATEGARVGVWDWDLITGDMYIDPHLKALLGYADDEIRNHIDDWSRFVHPDDLPILQSTIQAYTSGEIDRYEAPHRMLHKNGDICWFLARGLMVKDFNGQPVRLVGTSTDITELVSARLEAETLRDVTLALVSRTGMDDVLAEILSQARKLVAFDTANVVLVEHGMVRTAQAIGYEKYNSQSFVESLVYKADDYPITYTFFHKKKPIVVDDTRTDPNWVTFDTTAWIRSFMAIPLIAHDEALGALQFDSDVPGTFSLADAERLLPLATAAAIAIENAWLLFTAQKRAEQLALVHQVGTQINQLADEQEILNSTVALIHQSLQYDIVQIGKINAEKQTISVACRASTKTTPGKKNEQSIAQGIIGRAARTGKTQLVSDTAADPDYLMCIPDMQSELAVPIKVGAAVFGVLDVESTRRHAFDDADVIALEALAAQLGVILENANLYRQAKSDAETKGVLLREVNHRVKNNLAVIIGLLYLEQRRQNNAETSEMLQELSNRVRGMATVHELLSASVWQPISLEELIRQIIRTVTNSMSPTKLVRFTVSPSPLKIAAEQATNIALIINELATNSIKYGQNETAFLAIDVAISRDDDIVIEYRDNGPGFDESVLTFEVHNIGLELVRNIVKNALRGTILLKNDNGAVTILRFPMKVK